MQNKGKSEAAEREERRQYALTLNPNSHYDYSKPFSQQVQDWASGKLNPVDSLLVGRTPKILRDIGLNDLPLTFNQTHANYMVNGTKADHQMSAQMIAQLPQLLQSPIAVIESASHREDSVVVIVKDVISGHPVVAPIRVQTSAQMNQASIDANYLTSVYEKKSAANLLINAINKENANQVGVYYLDKSRASNLIGTSGVQFPRNANQDGLIHSIFDAGSPVNRKFLEQTQGGLKTARLPSKTERRLSCTAV